MYVQNKDTGRYIARTYYMSGSSALLRYLLRVTFKEDGRIEWFDKGNGEDSLPAPWEARMAMADLLSREPLAVLSREDIMLLFVGTTKSVMPGQEGEDQQMTYDGQIERIPERIIFNDAPAVERRLIPPEKLVFKGQDRPDFKDVKATWVQSSQVYGTVRFSVFPSMNRKYFYTFMMDPKRRACLSLIEKNGEINELGLNPDWVMGGSFTTPLKEYYHQSFGYGNREDVVLNSKGEVRYVDMFKNYLSKVGFIQEFIATVSDQAQTPSVDHSEKGGIDFNSSKMGLDIQNNGGNINFKIDATLLQRLEAATGFTPVILNIQPMPGARTFLGINDALSPSSPGIRG
jgi:hypothetical protein